MSCHVLLGMNWLKGKTIIASYLCFMHCNNPWKKNIPQKVKKSWNMTVSLALRQRWLQLTCLRCECGAEPFTFSCSIGSCHCHCVLSLGTLLPPPRLLLTPHICTTIRTHPDGAGGWGGGHEAGAVEGREGKQHCTSPSRSTASCLPPLRSTHWHGGYSAPLLASFQRRHTSPEEDVWPLGAAALNPTNTQSSSTPGNELLACKPGGSTCCTLLYMFPAKILPNQHDLS